MKLNTYLHFKDNCEAALKFYEKALGGKTVMMLRYGQSPAAHESSKDMSEKIMHGRIAIGDNLIMASDCPPDRFEPQAGSSINISVDTAADAEKYFKALSENTREIGMPIGETFWAERFGMLVDQFGISWMVNCEKKQ